MKLINSVKKLNNISKMLTSGFLFFKSKGKGISLLVAVLFAIAGLTLIIFSLFIPVFNDWSFSLSNVDASRARDYGGFVGGVAGALFALVSAILLYNNFRFQEKSFAKQSFESRYFEMIRLHRENVGEMSHKDPYSKKVSLEQGRRVFLPMLKQFREIYAACEENIGEIVTDEELIDIAYIYFFFGVGIDSREKIQPYLNKYSKVNFEDLTLQLYAVKAKYDKNVVKFGGHESRLGHYYRHLFQAVKFVDGSHLIEKIEKYEYIKMLRAQLSTAEQAILFYNSIAQIGREWYRSGYIANYHLIKNIPKFYLAPIEPKKYYSDIDFEYEEVVD